MDSSFLNNRLSRAAAVSHRSGIPLERWTSCYGECYILYPRAEDIEYHAPKPGFRPFFAVSRGFEGIILG
jgi:hypothetical protein